MASIQRLRDEIAQLKQENAHLRQALAEVLVTIQELQGQLGQNSHNSHWLSSRDKGRARRGSRRVKSEKLSVPGVKGLFRHFDDSLWRGCLV